MMSRTVALVAIAFTLAVNPGCDEAATTTDPEMTSDDPRSPLEIVATTGMIGDLVRGVVGCPPGSTALAVGGRDTASGVAAG